MRKLSLTVIGCYLSLLAAFSQGKTDSVYNKKLSVEEINFVAGYYNQDGDHSAVTGGIGTERLSDIATTIDLKLSRYDNKQRKHSYNFELGVDHYTSASSDKIDPATISSASHADTRIYPSLGWTVQNEQKGTTLGLTGSFSYEFDYKSIGLGASFTKSSSDNNRELNIKAQAYLDTWNVIYPVELRNNSNGENGSSRPRNSFSAAVSMAQVVNQQLQLSLVAEPVYQSGLLATKYQRVYFKDGNVGSETLPDTRLKLPLGIRANYFIGDRYIIRAFYRYYLDDWGVKAHTLEMEVPMKFTPFFSFSPFYRFYTQTAADYFAPYTLHQLSENFFTSDYDLSELNSHFFGAVFRFVPAKGVFGIEHLSSAEIKAGHYIRSEGLSSNIVSFHLTYK